MKKKFKVIALLLSCNLLIQGILPAFATKAEEKQPHSEVSEIIEEIIESDKEVLGKLSPTLQKLYEKLVSLFKKIGKMTREVKQMVDMYNELDETDEKYPERLMEWFHRYNSLGIVNRKLVSFITDVLNQKDQLLDNLRHIAVVDIYSDKQLESNLEGDVRFVSEDESVATVSNNVVIPVRVGMTRIVALNNSQEVEIFRVFVKKPILTVKVVIKKGDMVTIPLSADAFNMKADITKAFSAEVKGNAVSVTGLSKGTAYLYVGTHSGKTTKYKITIVK